MPEFKTESYRDVNNPQYKFYKLYIDGVCQFNEFLEDLEKIQMIKNYSFIYSDIWTVSVIRSDIHPLNSTI